MSEAKHPPGPWRVEKNSPNHIPAYNIWDAKGMMVGYLGHTDTIGQADANAKLIASAPALLEENARLRALLVRVRDISQYDPDERVHGIYNLVMDFDAP